MYAFAYYCSTRLIQFCYMCSNYVDIQVIFSRSCSVNWDLHLDQQLFRNLMKLKLLCQSKTKIAKDFQ